MRGRVEALGTLLLVPLVLSGSARAAVEGGPPSLVIIGGAAIEGHTGTTPLTVSATLQTPDGLPTTAPFVFDWETVADVATPDDYVPAQGTFTFPAGTASGTAAVLTVQVKGDIQDEPDEQFLVRITPLPPLGQVPAAQATVIDDDGTVTNPRELAHGGRLESRAGADGAREWFVVYEPGRSSYEVVLEAASGDLEQLSLRRLHDDGTTVFNNAFPVGTGQVLTLQMVPTFEAERGLLKVESSACVGGCGPDDGYVLRMSDTTLSAPRHKSAGDGPAVLVLFNRADRFSTAVVWCWNLQGADAGALQVLMPARSSVVRDLSAACPSAGSVTVSHDMGYGNLVGKLVELDPAAGFASDTPLESRPR